MPTQYHTSPFGEALHPWISRADTKYHPDGLYHLDLALDPSEETDAMVSLVTKAAEAALAAEREKMTPGEAKRWSLYNPVAPEEDAEGNPTGRQIATFKQNRVIKFNDKVTGELVTKTVVIAVKDASGKKDVHKPVFSGSILRVAFTMRVAKMTSTKQVGVRLDFSGVQIKKLSTSEGTGSRFGAVEDGYHADELDERDQAAFDPADDRRVTGDY